MCLLVLLATFSLPAHAQIPKPGDTSHTKLGDVGGGSKDTPESSSKEPPTVTTTPQAMSTEGEGDNESTVAVSPSEGPNEGGSSNGKEAAAKKKFREEFLFFQVRERISRHNLTLGDIEEVLSQKGDDGSQFLFTLANKLGYIVDGKYDDPHIPVIKSHREKLVALLEARKKSLMTSLQDKPKSLPAVYVSDEPPQIISEPVSDNINKVPVGSDVSKGGSSNGKEAAVKKEEREEFLYFQITKCISRRSLTLGDIEEVLLQKDDDGQFSFTLADKLGYIVDGKFDDPHMPVIKSHREKLVAKLEAKKKFLMVSSQDKPKSLPAETNVLTSKPSSDKDIHRIGFDVSKAILQLGPEAINSLLNNFSLPGTLGYAVGQKLGYSDHDVHMEYLENLKDDKVVASLQRILKSKLPKGTSSDGTPGESGGDKSEPVSKGVDQDSGNANSEPVSKGTDRDGGNANSEPVSQGTDRDGGNANSEPVSQGTDRDGGNANSEPVLKGIDRDGGNAKHHEASRPGQAGGPGYKTTHTTAPSGSEAGANSDRDGDGGAGDRHAGNGEPSAPSPSPPTQRTPPSRGDVEDSGNEYDNEGSQLPGDLTDDEQSYNYDDDDGDDLHGGFLSGIDEVQRMELVQTEGFQNYLATKYNELYEQFFEDRADPDKIGAVLDEYIEWKSEIAVNEKGDGGSDGSYKEIKPESKQGENIWIVHVLRS